VTLGRDNRDNIYYPTRGAFHRLQLNRSEGQSFPSYTELRADLRQYLPTPWKHVLALRAFGRRVSREVPFEDRLYWGGVETIRGYGYASLEGEEGYLLSLEYRLPFFLMPLSANGQVIGVGLHAFTDAGDAWYDGAQGNEALIGWGLGLHLSISTQQFRFEIARTKEGDNAFQFADHFNF
jgi:outer membrane protein assembly factor BamA